MSYYSGIQAILWDLIDPIEALIVLRFVIVNTGYKNTSRKGIGAQFICALGWLVTVLLNEKYIPYIPVAIIVCLFIFGVYAANYLRCSMLQYIFWYVMSIVAMTLFDALSFLVLLGVINNPNPYDYIMGTFNMRMSGALISKLMFLFFIEIYRRIKNGKREFEDKEISPELVISVAFAAVFVILFVYNLMGVSKNVDAIIRLNVYIIVLIMVVLVCGFYVKGIREKETMRKKNALITNECRLRNEYYEEDASIYEKMRETRHDAKHHSVYLDYLANLKKYNEMEDYLKQIISGGK